MGDEADKMVDHCHFCKVTIVKYLVKFTCDASLPFCFIESNGVDNNIRIQPGRIYQVVQLLYDTNVC